MVVANDWPRKAEGRPRQGIGPVVQCIVHRGFVVSVVAQGDASGKHPGVDFDETVEARAARWRVEVEGLLPEDRNSQEPGRPGPGEAESLRHYGLMRKLGLPRLPAQMERQEQAIFLVHLLDLEKTCRLYPQFGKRVKAILRRILA